MLTKTEDTTRIEDITKSEIAGMDLEELQVLRNRFVQMNDKWWGSEFWPDCSEEVALQKYRLVMDEYQEREIFFIPKEIDRALFGLIAKEISEAPGKLSKEATPEPVADGGDKKFTRFAKFIAVTKAEENPEHFVMSVVYEPDEKDTQEDWATADEIRKAAWSFMESDQIYKINHDEEGDIHVLESYIAPVDFETEGQKIKAGTWLLGSRVMNEETWEQIEKGELTGYSMAGEAFRIE